MRLALVGRLNAGKSSLLNQLLGVERTIVAPEPGATPRRSSSSGRRALPGDGDEHPAAGAAGAVSAHQTVQGRLERKRPASLAASDDGSDASGSAMRSVAASALDDSMLPVLRRTRLDGAVQERAGMHGATKSK